MQNRRLIYAMIVMTILILGWSSFVNWMYERNPQWRRPGQPTPEQIASEQTPDDNQLQPSLAPASPATQPQQQATAPDDTPQPTRPSLVATGLQIRGAPEQRTVHIGSDTRSRENPHRLRLAIDSTGAGLNEVSLNEFDAADVSDIEPELRPHYAFQQPLEGRVHGTRPMATRSITINGQVLPLAAVDWELVEQTNASATFAVEIVSGDAAIARVLKTYTLFTRDDGTLGYEIDVQQRVQNLSDKPIEVQAIVNGPVPPEREMFTMDDRQVIIGYSDEGAITVRSHMLRAIGGDLPRLDLSTYDEKRFAWFGTSSVYFAAIVRPKDAAQIANIAAVAVNPQSEPDDRLVATEIATAPQSIAPNAVGEITLHVFLGPKKRDVFNSQYYYANPLAYHKTLGTLSSACTNVCTADWIINSLVALLRFFHVITRDWGLAIIGLVLVVRLLLHPITKRSTISMHKMGKMGPEIERLKKKYGDNREELNKAMMGVYKEQGATPILGCLPMFLQMPIWIALWSALQNTFELRQAPFLYGLLWIDDLGKPDALLSWNPIPLIFGFKLGSLNLLPLLLGVVFFLQQKFTPKPPATTPEQKQQQKMMQFMTLLFPLFLYNGPAGLNLYILTSTSIGIIEMRRIRAHIKEREELEAKERPVIVDAGPTRGSKHLAKQRTPEQPEKRGLAKWLANLQEKADQMQREADKRKRRRDS